MKPLIGWLDRPPFRGKHFTEFKSVFKCFIHILHNSSLLGQCQFDELRKQIIKLGIEMATMGMRDRFSVKPVETVRHLSVECSHQCR